MPSLNEVILMGHLGRDPMVKYLPSGTCLATLHMATSERFKSGDEWKESTEWHVVKVWGKAAENIASATKGDLVFVTGALRTESWETSDGSKKYRTYVNAKMAVSFGGSKDEEKPSGSRDESPGAKGKDGDILF